MKDQDAKLIFDGVAKLRGLLRRAIKRNRDLTQCAIFSYGWEG
jgi:hypothetical protein